MYCLGKKNAKQNFLQGAFILVLATVLVKVVGAIFKIPLKPMIGGVASGFFSSAYGLFTPIYSVCVAGLPIAVSRMVAETSARGRYRDSRKIFRLSLVVFFVVGFVAMLIIAAFAKPFVMIQKSPGAIWAVLAIAPAVFFGCIMSAYRGYYEGLRNMTPTASSQLIEAVAKLIVGLALAFIVVQIGTACERHGIRHRDPAGSLADGRGADGLYQRPYPDRGRTLQRAWGDAWRHGEHDCRNNCTDAAA